VHDDGMRDIAVREYDLVDLLPSADGLQGGLVLDRDPVRVVRAGE
jgi:hypothetical protein